MKTALVLGVGFIGSHLAARLRKDGWHVRGVARTAKWGPQSCDEFVTMDLRKVSSIESIFANVDTVFQLACEVGGLGYLHGGNDYEILRNSMQVDLAVLEACRVNKIKSVFFASSGCVYARYYLRYYSESDAYPANPRNEFGWQKLYAERLYAAYGREFSADVTIGRLFNCYGPGMAYDGGREKVVGAICRKVAHAKPGSEIEVWGDGNQTRSFLYVDDAVEGILRLSRSGYAAPVNIGPDSSVSIAELAQLISMMSRKDLKLKFIDGPTGVPDIGCVHTLLRKVTGWVPRTSLGDGLLKTYPWVEKQVLDKALPAA